MRYTRHLNIALQTAPEEVVNLSGVRSLNNGESK